MPDPHGTQPVAPTPPDQTLKLDAGKARVDLLPTRPLLAVASVLAFGAEKYTAHGWRRGILYSRCYAAVLRHLWSWWRGENLDPESGLPHLAHAACALLFLLEYSQSPGSTLDDRADIEAQ